MNRPYFLRGIRIAATFVLILNLFWAIKSATAQHSMPLAKPHISQTIPLGAGRSGLLFVSRDGALAFYEPSSRQIQKLTEPFSGQAFSVSPDGRTILFGNQNLSLQSQASGEVSVSVSMLAHPREFSKLNWSPDGRQYGYVKQDGSTWIEDLSGTRQQLYKSDAPPNWSFDGRWMAYCDQRGRLWIAETAKPADWIAHQESCTVNWSPKKSVLAYVMFPERSDEKPANGTAYLYNPMTGRTLEIARSVSSLDWSPDGKLVSIVRNLSSSTGNPSYSVTIVSPATGQELFLEQYSPAMGQNPQWIEQKNGYLFGRYRFQTDLLTKEIIAEQLIDATQDGDKLLLASESGVALDVLCQDEETDRAFPLLQVTWSDLPQSNLNGKFSPDGAWLWLRDFVDGKAVYRLARCDDRVPLLLPSANQGIDPYFSTHSDWLVIEQTHAVREEFANISVLELKSGQIQEIPAGLDTHSVWLQMPGSPVSSNSSSSSAPLSSKIEGTTVANGSNSVELPIDVPKRVRPSVFIPLFLWAGALVAVVIFVIYRGKYPWK